jgi:hypothetical protein
VNTARGNIDAALAKDMMYFQMYGQQAGQSFHEKFTTSQEVMAGTANPMTLRVRADFNAHRTAAQNSANVSIARIIHTLGANSSHPHLNGALQTMRNNFAPAAGGVLTDLAAATNVREVEVALQDLRQALHAIRVDLVQEVLLIVPGAAVQPNPGLANSVTTVLGNYHIGKSAIGRSARKRNKGALRRIGSIAADTY